jgi:hypothetical protein
LKAEALPAVERISMKNVSLKLAALGFVAGAALFLAPTPASAAYVDVRIGAPPPPGPVVVERPWVAPYRGAVWIAPHYEAINGRWVWVHGYYTYPPRHGGYWVPGRYRHGYWRPGHWAY